MKHGLLSLFTLLVVSIFAEARQISEQEACIVAEAFLNSKAVHTSRSVPKIKVRIASKANNSQSQSNPGYYIFNADGNNGFVIVSADDRARKILGYSDSGTFDAGNIPPQLRSMLKQYSRQISAIPSNVSTDPSWITTIEAFNDDGVLLETSDWGQGYPYNLMTPEINGQHCPSGCVATAMAIVMKYHNWPNNGRYAHSYRQTPNHEIESMDYSQYNFDWQGMSQSSSSIGDVVSPLMRIAGHSVNTVYDLYESGSKTCLVGHTLQYYFKYSPECQYIQKCNWEESEWDAILRDQLDKKLPVIYSAASLQGDEKMVGHAFVIDGYQSDSYHINWGWDGFCNGYFKLNALSPDNQYDFSIDHGMVINIIPDKTDREYSPCWIDNGYLWRELDELGHSIVNPGTHVSAENVSSGTKFDYLSKMINVPVDFAGDFSVALVDDDYNIKHVFDPAQSIDYAGYDLFCDGINYTWNGVTLSCSRVCPKSVEPTWRLQTVAKSVDSDKWLIVLGTQEAPSWCELTKNTFGKVSVNIDDSNCQNVEYYSNTSDLNMGLLGFDYMLRIIATNGIARYYVNDRWQGNCDDSDYGDLVFKLLQDEYNIKIEYDRYEDLKEGVFNLINPGTLHELISSEEAANYRAIRLSGNINASDIHYIQRNFVTLEQLDLYDANIMDTSINMRDYAENTMPAHIDETFNQEIANRLGVWGLKSLILPASIKSLDAKSIISKNLLGVNIPEKIEIIKEYAFQEITNSPKSRSFEYVSVQNPNPIDLPESTFLNNNISINGVLFVPIGSKSKYQQAKGWNNYRDIIESNGMIDGSLVRDNNCTFMILNDCALLVATSENIVVSIPDEVVYNGKPYPVKYISSSALKYNDLCLLELPKYLSHIDLSILPNIIYLTLNGNKLDIRDQLNYAIYPNICYLRNDGVTEFSHLKTSETYFFTEKLSPNINCSKCKGVYIPGACLSNYKNVDNVSEMWKYELNKSENAIKITPLFSELVIDKVTVNGKEINSKDNIYYFDACESLDVIVDYTLHGIQAMQTHYGSAFNATLSDSDFSGIEDVFTETDIVVEIYNLNGICLYHGERSNMPALPGGIYIEKQTNGLVRKIIVQD